jgi:small-conductance mechanosensitive channel
MFETRSLQWEQAGLAVEISEKTLRRAQRQVIVLLPLFIAVLVLWSERGTILALHGHHRRVGVGWEVGTAVVLVAIGWGLASSLGRAVAPTFLRRMDPGTAGTVGFLMRLATIFGTLLYALHVVGVSAQSLAVGGAFTAVVLGLAAQQTLGNLIAGMVLISARPFKVGTRVRLQAGAIGGRLEGIVSSLGLLYTTLASGDDRVMIPNTQVLSAVIVPIVEPDMVDVTVRVGSVIRVARAQAILDESISTPTRTPPVVRLKEINGNEVVLGIQATPQRAEQGAALADEIIAALATVTDEHALTED